MGTLVLSREIGERLIIDTPAGQISITLVRTSRGAARIGISAPQDFIIYREEVANQRQPDQKNTEEPSTP